jgi:FAD/FMN-containing dehydrogenase
MAVLPFLMRWGLDFTVGGGRHTLYSTIGHAVLLSLNGMRGVMVDPERKVLMAQGGARNGDLDEALTPHGLGTPCGTDPDTGIGGLTCGGGIGYLSRRFGLACPSW